MFESLTEKFNSVFKSLSGRGKITEANVSEAMRQVRKALLEADVNYHVVKQFCKDVAQAAWLAATHPSAAGHIYNVTDGDVHTLEEIMTAMRKALGKRAYAGRIPLALMHTAAQLVTTASRWIGHTYPADKLLDKYLEDVAIDGSAIQENLGFNPSYDLGAGWRDLYAIQNRSTREC